jgi:hypothetical protein
MAKASTIGRLHAKVGNRQGERTDQLRAERHEVPLPAGRPVRGRFVVTKPQPEAEYQSTYQLDSATMMNICEVADAVDRSHDFQVLAAREKATQLARRWLQARQRGEAGSAGVRIQV